MRPVYGANNRFVHRKGYVIQKSALNGLYGSWPSVPPNPMFDKRLLAAVEWSGAEDALKYYISIKMAKRVLFVVPVGMRYLLRGRWQNLKHFSSLDFFVLSPSPSWNCYMLEVKICFDNLRNVPPSPSLKFFPNANALSITKKLHINKINY